MQSEWDKKYILHPDYKDSDYIRLYHGRVLNVKKVMDSEPHRKFAGGFAVNFEGTPRSTAVSKTALDKRFIELSNEEIHLANLLLTK